MILFNKKENAPEAKVEKKPVKEKSEPILDLDQEPAKVKKKKRKGSSN